MVILDSWQILEFLLYMHRKFSVLSVRNTSQEYQQQLDLRPFKLSQNVKDKL